MRGRYPLTSASAGAEACADRQRLCAALGQALRRSECVSGNVQPRVEPTLRELVTGESGTTAVLHCLLGDVAPLYPAILGHTDPELLQRARHRLRRTGGAHPTALLFNCFLAILDAAQANGADRDQLRQQLANEAPLWWQSIAEGISTEPEGPATPPADPGGTECIAAALQARPQPCDTALLDALAHSTGARQRARLILDWINQQAQDSLLPAPVRAQIPILRPWLIRIAICDEGVLLCASHPLRRLTIAYLDDAIRRHWVGEALRPPELPAPDWLAAAALGAAAQCPAYSCDEYDWLAQQLGQNVRDRHSSVAQRAARYVHSILREHLLALPDHAALMPLFARDFEPLLLATLRSHGTASPLWRHLMQRLQYISHRLDDDYDGHRMREDVARELIACEVGARRAAAWG